MNLEQRFLRLTQPNGKGSIRAKSVRAAAFTTASALFNFSVRLGSTAVLARLIIPEHFGIVMMAMAVTAMAEQVKDFGLSTATVQKPKITHQEVSNLFWLNVCIGTALTTLITAASPLIARYFEEPRLVLVTCILATSFLLSAASVQHQALLTRQLRLGSTSLIRMSAGVVSTLIAIIFALYDFGYWALVWRELSRALIIAAGMWVAFPWIPSLPSRQTSVRGLVSYGMDLMGANLLGTLAAGADRFFLGRIWGPTPVAIFRQAHQLMATPTDQLVSPLYQVAQPGLSAVQNDPERFQKFYRKLVTMVGTITMPISVFVAAFPLEVTQLMLGSQWLECAPVLRIIAVGTFGRQVIGSSAQILLSRGNSRLYLKLSAIQNLLMVTAIAIGALWGVSGIAWAEVGVIYVLAYPRLLLTFRASPINFSLFLGGAWRPAMASIGMGGALYAVKYLSPNQPVLITLLTGGVTAALSFTLTWILLPGGKQELLMILADLRSAAGRKLTKASAPAVPAR